MIRALLTFTLVVAAAVVRADITELDPGAKPNTRIGPRYEVALSVAVNGLDEKELCGRFEVDGKGRLPLTVGFKPIEPVAVLGLTAQEAARRVTAAITGYFRTAPEVRVGIAKIPRFEVLIQGASFRNGPLSLPDGSRLSDALAAAGYLPSADLHHVEVARVDGGKRLVLAADFGKALEEGTAGEDRDNDPPLQLGDVVRIPQTSTPEAQPMIAVAGEVRRQGVYPYKPGMTVRDALDAALGMTPAADPDRVTVGRTRGNRFTTVSGARAMKNEPTENLKLEPDDTVIVATLDRGLSYAVTGAVASPNRFPYRGQVTLTEAITAAGGFRPEADTGRVVLFRGAMLDPSKATAVEINYDRVRKGEMPDAKLEPGDWVQIQPRRKPGAPNWVGIGISLLRMFLF